MNADTIGHRQKSAKYVIIEILLSTSEGESCRLKTPKRKNSKGICKLSIMIGSRKTLFLTQRLNHLITLFFVTYLIHVQ